MNHLKNCRVCGLEQSEPPWGPDGASPSFLICACCGVEFGYEDSNDQAIYNYRDAWIKNNHPWFSKKEKPPEWDLKEQLLQIPEKWRIKT